GGKLDYLETLEECAVRETREEVGLDVSAESLLCATDHLLPQESQHWVSPAYLGRVLLGPSQELRASENQPDPVVWTRGIASKPHHDRRKCHRGLQPPARRR